ncbi:MAG: mechanosensitive ion channel family protein [Gemmatimonadales bacterium]
MGILEYSLYGNTVQSWAVAVLVALLAAALLRLVERLVKTRLGGLAERTATTWDDLLAHTLSNTKRLFYLIVAIYVATLVLVLPAEVQAIADRVVVLALLVQGGIWVTSAVTFWLDSYRDKELTEDAAAVTTVSALGFLSKLAVWAVAVLLALDNLGIDVTALVTGLGIGGIAVALAVQNVLGDLLASLSIVLDKPFVINDFLIVDEHMGNVEHIGLKTTRLRSLSGEQLVFSNSDLLKSRIRNYGRMYERRVTFTVGVTYQTPREKLEIIPTIIRDAIGEHDKARFDRSHLKAFGDFSINFETVYYVLDPSYSVYMDIQQAVNLRVHERFEAEGIEFAYPTQTLFVVKEGSPS